MIRSGGRSDRALVRRLLADARPHWPQLAGLLALGLLSVPLALLGPLPLKIAVDSAVGSRPLPGPLAAFAASLHLGSPSAILALAAALIVLIALLRQAVHLAENWLRAYVQEFLNLAIRARLFRHAQRLSVAHHDTRGVTDSLYRIQSDVPESQAIVVEIFPSLLSAATLAGMFWITARIDWQLALAGAAIAPGLILLHAAYRKRFRVSWHAVKDLEHSALSVVHEVLGALRVVKAFGQEDREQERFAERLGDGVGARLRMTLTEGSYGLQVAVLTAAGAAAVLWFGVRHVQAGTLTLGQLLVVMAYMAQFYEPLKTLSRRAGKLQSRLASAERVFALLDSTPDVIERPHARPLGRFLDSIDVSGVSFGYHPGSLVLRDVTLRIPRGARVGISGPTGSGKTTLAGLLARFYDPVAGEIRLDGADLRDYRLADLRALYAIVLQDSVLFSTSVAENIAYARPGADPREIVAAAEMAGAHAFITALPHGYDTPLGERGMNLSGGERQRISLARAFLKDAPILILDEPTSAVDPRTEAGIGDSLERLMRGRTTILIAHRSSLFEHCDVRLAIEDGRVEIWRPDSASAAAGS